MKKAVSIILALSMILSCFPLFGSSADEPKVRWSAAKLETGEVSVYLTKVKDDLTAVLALYGDDTLLDVATAVVKEGSASLSITVPEVDESSSVKLLLWDEKSLEPAMAVLSTITPRGIVDGAALRTTDTGTVKGTVSVDGAGVSGITVKLSGAEERRTVTDESGKYTFADVPVGEYTVTADIPANAEAPSGNAVKVKVELDKTAEADFAFKKREDLGEEEKIVITTDTVFASVENEGEHRVSNIADGSLDTYWSASGVGEDNPQSVTAVFETPYAVSKIGVAFGVGSERSYIFEVSSSTDGKHYKTILERTTSELTDEMQYFNLPSTSAKFLRVTLLGRTDVESGWAQISEIEAYGIPLEYDEGEEAERYTFSDKAGTSLSEGMDGFSVRAMTEETYTDYTPSLGDKLYASIDYLPQEAGMGTQETALYIHDAVGRKTSAANGAGGLLAGKQYPTVSGRGKYNISFEMFMPKKTIDGEENNLYWSGFSLTDEFLTGGADLSKYAAIQVRFNSNNGKVQLNTVNSNQFNEGSMDSFMSTWFEMGRMWTISMDVDPIARRTDITVSDGINSETKPLYFTYNDVERARITTWSGLEAKWLVFNSGAGASCDMYVDNIVISHYTDEEKYVPETTLMADIDFINGNDGNIGYRNISDNQGSYVGSLGKNLYAEIAVPPAKAGITSDAIHLYDTVGRETDSANGAGAVAAYVDLPYTDTDNAYKIEFTMYAPVADDYGGFSLSHGRNTGNNSTSTPMALQMRFKESAAGGGIQFNRYESIGFNDGSWSALVGSYTAIDNTKPLYVEIIVNPTKLEFEITIDDGVNSQTRTQKYATKNSSNNYEYWMTNKVDTLMISTGIGGNGDIYVGDIRVTDLGDRQNMVSAIHGILRLCATNGTGKFVHHNGNENANLQEKQDPNYTRFVERSGLMDSDGVSFEVMNRPGYYLVIVPGADNIVQVQPFSNTARFKANATFYKEEAVNAGSYTGTTVSYRSYRDPSRFLYDNSGQLVVWKMYTRSRAVFYLRSEASTMISDNFKGTSLSSQWRANYPWDTGNLGHHNTTGIARSSNVIVKDGVCLLNTTKIDSNDWNAKDEDGNTGIDLSGYNFYDSSGNKKGWKKYTGYVGVISSGWNTFFWRQSYMEGSFKQPDCASGYWNAFWLSPQSGWPPETDIFEYLSSKDASQWYTYVHGQYETGPGAWFSLGNGTLRTQYHTYALDWGYDYMDFYFDGKCYARYTGTEVNYQNKNGMRIIINGGLGGWENEPDSRTAWNTGLRIQWFRSFQYA